MRMPLLAIAVLLTGSAGAFADDMPQPDMTQGQVSGPTGPVKIIDTAPATPPAPTGKTDQALPPAPPPPPVSTQAKTQKDSEPAADGSRFSFVRVDDSRRSGILTQALLAAQDKPYRTSIVRRGLKVRTGLLCQTVNAPPNDVQLNLDSIAPGLSQRDRLAQHRENPTCAGCHSLLDPIGVVFESFDAVGRYRTRDEDDQPIDTSSEISETRDANGEVRDVRGLGALLAASSEVRDCYVTQTFRFFFGRDVEAADACSLAALQSRFAEQDLSLSELLVALTQTDAFLYRPTLEVSP